MDSTYISGRSENVQDTTLDYRSVLVEVSARVRAEISCCILTMSRWFPEARQLERVFSTDAAVYPVGGRKNKPVTPWSDTVLREQIPHLACSAEAIRLTFDDHELLVRTGITSILNVPISAGGTCVGTMNLMRGGEPLAVQDAEHATFLVRDRASDLATALRLICVVQEKHAKAR